MLSEFVDGYFAEVYFEDIEGLIEKNPELFCKTVKALPTQKTLRLSEAKKKSGCL
jgi:hypothetical protein